MRSGHPNPTHAQNQFYRQQCGCSAGVLCLQLYMGCIQHMMGVPEEFLVYMYPLASRLVLSCVARVQVYRPRSSSGDSSDLSLTFTFCARDPREPACVGGACRQRTSMHDR